MKTNGARVSKIKPMVLALSLVAGSALASNCFSAVTPKFIAAGSSAVFNSFANAAFLASPGFPNGVCGSATGANLWTQENGKPTSALAIDNRPGGGAALAAPIWVVWDGAANGTTATVVCAYMAVDSIVGLRLMDSAPRGSISLANTPAGTLADPGVVPGFDYCCLVPLPAAIQSLFPLTINAAPTDIRPEDAKVGSDRALASLGAAIAGETVKGLGYGPVSVGVSIKSWFSTGAAQPVNFNLGGKDPITNIAVAKTTAITLGAQTLMVVVNNTDANNGGLGHGEYTNVDRFTLARMLAGLVSYPRDLIPADHFNVRTVGLTVLLPDPLSGTMNTMEFSITNAANVCPAIPSAPGPPLLYCSQESGVNPSSGGNGTAGISSNPLNLTNAGALVDGCGGAGQPACAVRARVIGTGEMIKQLSRAGPLNQGIPDSIGYLFWSTGNAAGLYKNGEFASYLTVDGVDPINDHYVNGKFPQCGGVDGRVVPPCLGLVPFTHVIDGSYPIWNILRVVVDLVTPQGVMDMINGSKAQVANIPDYVSIDSLAVFRSHYNRAGAVGHNGTTRRGESGGDVGGMVFSAQEDLDTIHQTGKELTGLRQ